MIAITIHLKESAENLMRNENHEKLVEIAEDLLETLKFICPTEKSVLKQYVAGNHWATDFLMNVTPVTKFWNSNLVVDFAYYMRLREIQDGNLAKFWEEFERR